MATSSNFIFNGALIGAMGGPEAWIESTELSDYSARVNAAVAFANAVLTFASDPDVGFEEPAARLMASICGAAFANRPDLINSSDFTNIAEACVAAYNEAYANLEDETTGGTTIAPLTNAFFVDPESSAVTPDGSIANPYPTIQAAFDARGSNATYLLSPSTSVSAGNLTVDSLGANMAIVGLTAPGGGNVSLGDIHLDSVTNSGVLALSNANTGSITESGEIGWDGNLYVTNAEISGAFSLGNTVICQLQNVQWDGNMSTSNPTWINCTPPTGHTIAVGGLLTLDQQTYQRLAENNFQFFTLGVAIELLASANQLISDYNGTSQALLPVATIAEGGLVVRINDAISTLVGSSPNQVPVWDGSNWNAADVPSGAGAHLWNFRTNQNLSPQGLAGTGILIGGGASGDFTTQGNQLTVVFTGTVSLDPGAGTADLVLQVLVDDAPVVPPQAIELSATGDVTIMNASFTVWISGIAPGDHTVRIQYVATGGNSIMMNPSGNTTTQMTLQDWTIG